jgi:hypothetical protein
MRNERLSIILIAMVLVAGFIPKMAAGRTPDWEALIVAEGPTAASEREALAAAIRILPRLPVRVAVIDANDATTEVRARADEHGARKREESLWTSFVRDQRVDQLTALRYLSALSKRPDDQLLALR